MADMRVLSVRLEAQTSGYLAQMNSAGAATQGFGRKVDSSVGQADTKLKTLEKSATAGIGSLSGLSKAGALLGVGFGAAKVVDVLRSSVAAASDLNETVSKAGVVFGPAGAEVVRFGERSAKALGISKNEAIGAAATFGNLFVGMKIGQQPAADMSTRLVTLAGDLASFNNVDPATALEALRSGLVGETEPLRRFGVNLNQVSITNEAVRLGLIKTTKDALTPAAKAQATYSLVLQQTKTAQGDFARTSGGLANQQRILSAEWQNAQATLGRELLPAMVGLAHFATGTLIPAINGVLQVVESAVSLMGRFPGPVKEATLVLGGLVVGLYALSRAGSLIKTLVAPSLDLLLGKKTAQIASNEALIVSDRSLVVSGATTAVANERTALTSQATTAAHARQAVGEAELAAMHARLFGTSTEAAVANERIAVTARAAAVAEAELAVAEGRAAAAAAEASLASSALAGAQGKAVLAAEAGGVGTAAAGAGAAAGAARTGGLLGAGGLAAKAGSATKLLPAVGLTALAADVVSKAPDIKLPGPSWLTGTISLNKILGGSGSGSAASVTKALQGQVPAANADKAAWDDYARKVHAAHLPATQMDKLLAVMPKHLADNTRAQELDKSAILSASAAARLHAVDLRILSDSITSNTTATANAWRTTDSYSAAVASSSEMIKANGRTHDQNTVKGRANREALLALVDASHSQQAALIGQNASAAVLNGTVNAQRTAFIRQAIATGYSKDEANKLATQLGLIPKQVSSQITLKGAAEAEAALARLSPVLRNAHYTQTVSVLVSQRGLADGDPGQLHGTSGPRRLPGKAIGGRIAAGELSTISERGIEGFRPDYGSGAGTVQVLRPTVSGVVIPHAQMVAAGYGPTGSASARPQVVEVNRGPLIGGDFVVHVAGTNATPRQIVDEAMYAVGIAARNGMGRRD